MRHAILLVLSFALSAVDDRPIAATVVLESAQALYRSQVLGDLGHPVGEQIAIAGKNIATKRGEKGELELDVDGDGKFQSFAKSQLLPISVVDGTKTEKIKIYLERHTDGSWTYRNASQLAIVLGKERLVLVDVNGDGAFNTPGVDGMAWAGNEWLFPLPATDERFCTETLDLTGLTLGARGDGLALKGRPLATTIPITLPILLGINRERVKLGLSPRPEDPALSADLQKHCSYMSVNNVLTHPEDPGKPGFSAEGNASGQRSILNASGSPDHIAALMVGTYFHRQDVIRPETLAFGVGYEGKYGGIDGRTNLAPNGTYRWPILCPAPDQKDVPVSYGEETPDATPNDDQAGYAITAHFGSGNPTLTSYELVAVSAPKVPIDCYAYDRKTGASPDFSNWQQCVCLIAKEPLKTETLYEVTLEVDRDGKPWVSTWRFTTGNQAATVPNRKKTGNNGPGTTGKARKAK